MADREQNVSEKLRRANVANIIAKLRTGKTLTKTEQDALSIHEGLGPDGEPERLRKNKLAPLLGITRVVLDAYLKRADPPAPLPDANSQYSVEEVAKYISEIRGDGTKKNWTEELRRGQAETVLANLEILRGKYISKEEASKTVGPLMHELAEMMRMEFELILPAQYKGRDMVECAALNQAAIDKIITRFRTGMTPIAAVA